MSFNNPLAIITKKPGSFFVKCKKCNTSCPVTLKDGGNCGSCGWPIDSNGVKIPYVSKYLNIGKK
jgi:hypothetical protein